MELIGIILFVVIVVAIYNNAKSHDVTEGGWWVGVVGIVVVFLIFAFAFAP